MVAACMLALAFAGGCRQEAATTTAATEPAQPKLAQGRITFVEGFTQGCEQARQQSKPMLVFFTAHWCHYCHAMAEDALSQESVVSRADQFVCVLVDADAEPEVCRQFRVRGYPTVQFLSPQGVPLNRVTGKQPAHLLVMEMQAALQAVARRPGSQNAARTF